MWRRRKEAEAALQQSRDPPVRQATFAAASAGADLDALARRRDEALGRVPTVRFAPGSSQRPREEWKEARRAGGLRTKTTTYVAVKGPAQRRPGQAGAEHGHVAAAKLEVTHGVHIGHLRRVLPKKMKRPTRTVPTSSRPCGTAVSSSDSAACSSRHGRHGGHGWPRVPSVRTRQTGSLQVQRHASATN